MEKEKIGKIGIILLMIAGVVLFFMEKMNPPKVYEGTGDGYEGQIISRMTMVKNSKGEVIIKSIDVEHDETDSIGGKAIETLKGKLIDKPFKNQLDIVAGATYTSQGFIQGVDDGVNQFKSENK